MVAQAGAARSAATSTESCVVNDVAYTFSLRGPYDRHGAKPVTVAYMDALLATVKLDVELPGPRESAAGTPGEG